MYYTNSELYHHGIMGQKWGVRKWQNEDGSLTDAGRKHYGVGTTEGKSSYRIRKEEQYRNKGMSEESAAIKAKHADTARKVAIAGASVAAAGAAAAGGYAVGSALGNYLAPMAQRTVASLAVRSSLKYKNFMEKYSALNDIYTQKAFDNVTRDVGTFMNGVIENNEDSAKVFANAIISSKSSEIQNTISKYSGMNVNSINIDTNKITAAALNNSNIKVNNVPVNSTTVKLASEAIKIKK